MSPTLIHCSLCGFVVSKQFSLSSHISSKHFQCLICGNVFGSTLELNSHKKSEHHENCGGNICVSKSSTVDSAPLQKIAEAGSKNIEDKNLPTVNEHKDSMEVIWEIYITPVMFL